MTGLPFMCFLSRRIPTLSMFTLRSVGILCRRSAVLTWRGVSQRAVQRLDISGVYPPIATPFTQSEDVDYQKLCDNLNKYADVPFRGGFISNIKFAKCNEMLKQTFVTFTVM